MRRALAQSPDATQCPVSWRDEDGHDERSDEHRCYRAVDGVHVVHPCVCGAVAIDDKP